MSTEPATAGGSPSTLKRDVVSLAPMTGQGASQPTSSSADLHAVPALPVDTITPGVFFDPPGPLPRGRHKLTRDQVRDAQRERLLAAATELLAAEGYRGFGAGDVAKRANVSLAAFYENFEHKDACLFAGYDRFIEVLLKRMTSIDVTGLSRNELVQTLLGAYLTTLQSDLVVARAYQFEIDSVGPVARQRRRESLKLFADFMRQLTIQTSPDRPVLPSAAYIGVVYATRQLASDALEEPGATDLGTLQDEIEPWVADVFRDEV